jgi:hypothetical protein
VPSFAPYVGMKFRNLDETWKFWLAYGGQTVSRLAIRRTHVLVSLSTA